jgi:perosamine synthetase
MNPSKYLGNELKYIEQVLNSESWSGTGGSWNNALEQKFAEKMGVRYAIAMNSGTATIHSSLVAAGVGAGDEVISPALTVIMDSTATLHAGATPVYADIDPYTFNIDPKDIERKITAKTKAIIPVALYGLVPDMDSIMEIADKYNLIVIEDNAQCFMGYNQERLAGSFGHMASYSLENTKHLSCGEGGIVTTNDEIYAEKIRKIGGHGFKNLKADEGRVRLNQDVFQNPNYKRHDTLGWNYRLPEFNAAVALAQLERIDELVELRVKSAELFREVLDECEYFDPQFIPEGYYHSYYTLGVVYHGAEVIGVTWEDFRKAYIENGGDGIYGAWSVPYQEPIMIEMGIQGDCPVAESIQTLIMQFKTNYRDLGLAAEKAEALHRTIEDFK